MFSQGVSVFGNSPPEVVVGEGAITGVSLGVAEGVGVAVSVGVAVGVGVSVGVGVGVAVAVSVGVALGVAVLVGVAVGVAVSVGVAETVAVSVGVGVTAAAQTSLVMVLLSRVTAPLRASSWPLKEALVFAVMLVRAKTFPVKSLEVPKVAEEPTCQNT